MAHKVLIPEPIGDVGMQLLSRHFCCVAPWRDGSAVELPQILQEAVAVVVRIFPMHQHQIAEARQLRVIAKHGVGLDNIDLKEATRRQIPVLYTPGSNANAVAEHTLALMLALARRLGPAEASVREGWHRERSEFLGFELAGKTLGIVGLGRIGKRVALKAAQGLGMRVLAYDPYVDAWDYPGPARLQPALETLLQEADLLSLHVPLTAVTKGLIDRERLRMMKPSSYLINTSRGAVVDEEALAEALQKRELAGAALDVFEHEPLPLKHPLLAAPNLVLTPHIAGQTDNAMEASSIMVAEGVIAVLQGQRPRHVANPDVWE